MHLSRLLVSPSLQSQDTTRASCCCCFVVVVVVAVVVIFVVNQYNLLENRPTLQTACLLMHELVNELS